MPRDKLRPTARQREIYGFIRAEIFERGYGPTVREIASSFGIGSPNGVMCHLRALEKKGMIRREPNLSRTIQLLDEAGGLLNPRRQRNNSPTQPKGMPLAGVIAAGQPLEAIEQPEWIEFGRMFGNKRDLFALQVRGQSMIEDQIDDGDYVVVRKQETARDGQIVVALLGDGEATLKRFFREANRVRLEPANREMKPIFAKHVRIVGVVVGVVRRYS